MSVFKNITLKSEMNVKNQTAFWRYMWLLEEVYIRLHQEDFLPSYPSLKGYRSLYSPYPEFNVSMYVGLP